MSHLMEYITLCLDSTNEVEQWYVRHNYFYCLNYVGNMFRPRYRSSSGLLLQKSP